MPAVAGASPMLQERDSIVPKLSMRSARESTPSAQIVCDRTGRIESINAAWSSLLGYRLGETPSLFGEALYADGPAGVAALLDAIEQANGPMAPLAMRLRRQDGSVFAGRVQCFVTVVGGNAWYTAWIAADAAGAMEQQSAARQLPDRKDFEQDLLLNKLLAGAAIFSAGAIVRANATFAQMFGFSDAQALKGLEIRGLYEDDAEFQRFHAESLRSFAHDGNCSSSWRARRQDGSTFQAQARGHTVEVPGMHDTTIWMVEDEADIRGAEAIRQENESYTRMFQDSSIAISVYDPSTDFYVDCNEAARKLYGFERAEDLRGCTVLSISAPMQERGPTEKILAAGRRNLVDTGRESPSFEWRHRRPDGTDWIAECRGTTFRYRGKTLIQFTLIVITAAKEVQRQVKEMAIFLQTMIDRMPNAVFYEGPDTRLLGCNEAMEKAFGVQRDAMVGKRPDELDHLPAPLRSELQAEHERVIANAAHVSRETRLRFADGREHQVLYAVSGFRQRDGSPGGLVGVLVDLDPLKAAQSALSVAHKEQAAMFETAGVGIAFLREGVIVRGNRELETMFGYAPGELEGRRMGIWYGGDADLDAGQARLDARIGAPRDSLHDQEFVRKNGERFWCRITARDIDAETVQGSVWFMEDVTEERAIATALAEAKRDAEESAQAKSMFLANMSHEIRTPMNAIIGLSMLALRTDLDKRQRDYISKVNTAGTALLGIINDILDFSKVEAGKLDIETAPFRLDELLDNVAVLLAQKAGDKGLELLFDTARDVPPVLLGDSLRIGQIITNLVSNAVKFTESGQVVVSVRLLEREGTRVQLRVDVRDSGIGMTPEQVGRLFQAFAQADGSTTRKYGGTGLGLTISKRLVELMCGEIHAESTPGVGSVFWFTLGLGIGDDAVGHKPVDFDLMRGMRVLVVDDNDVARELMEVQLSGMGFAVDTAASGEEALAAVHRSTATQPYGVMVVDWQMPGMDGIETARRVRHLDSSVRIVMATSFGRSEVRAQAEAVGIEAFVVKPVGASVLVDALMTALGLHPAVAARPAPAQDVPTDVLRGVRLLLAEDNEINQQIAIELLEGAGAKVQVANNGKEAVQMVRSGARFDAVLMDLQMPVMGGVEATALIRADHRFDDLPIIAMTAHAMVEERERCLAAGMVDHITKPVDPPAMFKSLLHWVKARPEDTVASAGAAPMRAASGPVPRGAPGVPASEELPQIEGLDTVAGLRRVGGNRGLYLRLLRQFVDGQAEAADRIQASLAAGRQEEAVRGAHTVRGVAGNIGLSALHLAAATLEDSLHCGRDPAVALSAFGVELSLKVKALRASRAMADVGVAGAAQAPSAVPDAVDATVVTAHAQHFAGMLIDGDARAEEYLDAHRASLRLAFGAVAFAGIEQQVRAFDFDLALESARHAAEAQGVALVKAC